MNQQVTIFEKAEYTSEQLPLCLVVITLGENEAIARDFTHDAFQVWRLDEGIAIGLQDFFVCLGSIHDKNLRVRH